MMKCGHAANAHTKRGDNPNAPCCAICIGINPGADEVNDNPPDLSSRTAKCSYGGNEVPSSTKLAFFEHCPDKPYDRYYCGCFGWD